LFLKSFYDSANIRKNISQITTYAEFLEILNNLRKKF